MTDRGVDERTPCRVCGLDDPAEELVLREMMFGTRERFRYRRCRACGSLSIIDLPPDLERFYPRTYYTNEGRQAVGQDPAWRRVLVRHAVAADAFGRSRRGMGLTRRLTALPDAYRTVRPFIRGGALTSFDDPILDVGCGPKPVRLAMLRKVGFRRLLGVEPFIPDHTAYQGVPIQRGHLEDVEGTFRLIMFHHSLEHVPDPVATMRAAAARLARGGRILVRTPVIGGSLWRQFGTDWVELDAPRHIVVFSLAGLARIADAAGLGHIATTWESGGWEIIASEQYRRDIAMYEPGSWFVDRDDGAYDPVRLREIRTDVKRRNAEGDAGRAAVWFGHAALVGQTASERDPMPREMAETAPGVS